MGASSRRKGANYEREIVARHTTDGIPARKVPLSGAMAEYPGDVLVGTGFELQGEVKARKAANGFKKVRDWLGDNDLLFLREIGNGGGSAPEPIVAMPWKRYVDLMQKAGYADANDAE